MCPFQRDLATQQYCSPFAPFMKLYKNVMTFESVNEILKLSMAIHVKLLTEQCFHAVLFISQNFALLYSSGSVVLERSKIMTAFRINKKRSRSGHSLSERDYFPGFI